MVAHRITSIEREKTRAARHDVIVAVHTEAGTEDSDRRWTVKMVLAAMNRAERFYVEAPNGRRARVQRYQCRHCRSEHIRTHVSDQAIHMLENLTVS
jgi:hypothetical protein